MFKAVAALEYAVYVHAALVGEGVAAHVGHAFIHVEVGKFADEARRIAQKGKCPLRQGAYAHFQFQIGQNFAEVGVAAALAIAVDGALHLHGPGLDRGQRAGGGQTRVVVAVDGHGHGKARRDLAHYLVDGAGQRAAVGIAEGKARRPAARGGLQRGKGVGGVLAVAVEEVFGVEKHAHAVFGEEARRVLDHGKVLFRGDADHVPRLRNAGLAHDAGDVRAAFQQGAQPGVVLRAQPGAARHAKGGEAGVFQMQLFPREAKQLRVLGVGKGIAGLYVADAQFVQRAHEFELVFQRKDHARGLHAVAQRRIQHFHCALFHALRLLFSMSFYCSKFCGEWQVENARRGA